MKVFVDFFLVNFRCIPVYSDLRGYFSTVDVYIIVNNQRKNISNISFSAFFKGPMNNILRRWLNLQTTWGSS